MLVSTELRQGLMCLRVKVSFCLPFQDVKSTARLLILVHIVLGYSYTVCWTLEYAFELNTFPIPHPKVQHCYTLHNLSTGYSAVESALAQDILAVMLQHRAGPTATIMSYIG